MEGQWAPCGEGDPVGEHRRQVAPEAAGQPAGLSAHWCPCVGCPAPQPSGLWWKNGPSSYQDPNRLQRRGAQGAPSGRLVTDSHCLAYPAPSPENRPCFQFLVSQGNWGSGTTCPLEAQTDSVGGPRGVQRSAWLWRAPWERSCWVLTAGNSVGTSTAKSGGRLRVKGLP